jgi:hypothetical protein
VDRHTETNGFRGDPGLGDVIAALLAIAALFLAAPAVATPADTEPSPASAARTITGSASVFAGNFSVAADEVREGDVTVFGGNVTIDGRVTHDVSVFGGNAVINGTVGHDLTMFGGNLRLGPHAVVGHDLSVIGGNLDRDPGAQVGHDVVQGGTSGGSVLPSSWPWRAYGPFGPPGGFWPGFDFGLVLSFGFVLLALLAYLFFPGQVATTREAFERRPLASLGYGCLTAIGGVLLAALLGITIILLPASLAIAIALVVGGLLGWAAFLTMLGQRLASAFNWRLDHVLAFLIAGALVAVVTNIPIVGGLFGLVVGSMALGAAVLTRFGTRPAPPSASYGPPMPPPPYPPAPPTQYPTAPPTQYPPASPSPPPASPSPPPAPSAPGGGPQ